MNQIDPESWRTQLTELNNRSRMYATQLWAVPFTFLLAAGTILQAVIEESLWPLAMAPVALIGVVVFVIYIGTYRAICTVVGDIRRAETALYLTPTAKTKHPAMDWGYCGVIVLVTVGATTLALCPLTGICRAIIAASVGLVIAGGCFWYYGWKYVPTK